MFLMIIKVFTLDNRILYFEVETSFLSIFA